MKVRLFAGILAAFLLLTLLAPAAYAEETEATEETIAEITAEQVHYETSGECGKDITWELRGNVLYVTGTGEMEDGCPWEYYKDKIKKVTFSDGITYVGAEAFQECENLIAIDFGDSMKTIGAQAFMGCTALESIHLPDTFRKFGQNSFRDCTDLESIFCDGGMPSFQGGCLHTGNHIVIYTPVNNPWPMESAQELMRNYGGRLEIVAGGEETYKEAYVEEPTVPPTTQEPTEAPTEPPTQPTVPPTTVPPVTVPETQAPTEPVAAAAATEPVEETVWDFLQETQPEEQKVQEQLEGSSWIGMLLIAGVLTFLILGALIFRIASRRGGRYTE